MAEQGFVHLHVHSEYSLLDGAARIEAPKFHPEAPTIFTEAARHGMSAVAVTDHGAMFGALRFFEAGRTAGIKPIIGVEAYVAPGSRFERNPGENEEKYHHLTLLAENETGYRNLLKLVSAAYLEGFYHRPRMDKELLAEHAEGVICLSGCLSSELSTMLLAGQDRRAEEAAGHYRDIFGPDRFFMELQDHGIPDQRRVLPKQVALARSLGIPLVATNDLHYTVKEDAKPHDVLLCIQQQKLQSDPKRLKFDSEEFYLKGPQEMRQVFRELPEACDNTLLIAERIELDLVYGDRAPAEQRFHLPRFETPDGKDLEGYLRELVYAGAPARYPALTDDIRSRIDDELAVITQMGFAGYFLIVWDLIRFARESGIRVGPGRGSAAGSVVSYCLKITDLDPLRYGLIFERFLNPARRSMPDIDMDFDERRRDEVIRYATERYGSDHVAQIITFQTIKGKQGIRDAARVLGFPPVVGDRLCKMYPATVMGRDFPIEDALKESPEFREAYEKEPEAKEIVDTARALEGLRREDSVHAAGVVIGDAPLVNYLPLKLSKDSRDDSKRVVTQFDMVGVEALGLLKMDFLGLRTLSVIDDTLRHLRARGIELDVDHIPLDDAATYRMLQNADTTGVFQMESAGMRSLIKTLAPDRFEDMMALVALYRPGPLNQGMHTEYAERKHARRKVTYPHPDLGGDPLHDVRRDGLPGADHADRCAGGGVLHGTGRRSAARDGEEEARADRRGAREVPGGVSRGRSPGSTGQGAVRPHRAVRGLRVPGRARVRVRLRRLPDRVPEGPPPGRVHVGDAHERQGRQGPQAVLPERLPTHGHRGACRPTSTSPRTTSLPPREQKAPSATGCRPCATWGRGPSARSSTLGAGRARSRPSGTSVARWSRRCSPSACWRA